MTELAAEDLSIGYGTTVVASGINLSLTAGSITCLLGPNGVGKTTLFKTLLGLIAPIAGVVRLDDQPLSHLARIAIARRVAYVPQAYAGDLAFTVLDLVVMGRTAYVGPFGSPSKADLDVAMSALGTLGIADLAHRDAGRVSGGQRQLALVARALAQQAGIVVMDEPTASLDLGNRLLILDRIRKLAADGLAVLLSTHEPEQAFAVADSVATLGRQNRFDIGPARTILTSQHLSALYGVELLVEQTSSGRLVVGPGAA